MFFSDPRKLKIPTKEESLPGRSDRMSVPDLHFVSGHRIVPPFPSGMERALFGMGCFWGAEKMFWLCDGVYSTAVGYAAGHTPNPSYYEVCSGRTGHNEVVQVVFDPKRLRYEDLLRVFWEGHDPTQGMRQGADSGTQYRSGIYCHTPNHRQLFREIGLLLQVGLESAGYGAITTEILDAPEFYYAEAYHQQYLAKNPDGYCGHGGTGVSCPIGIKRAL